MRSAASSGTPGRTQTASALREVDEALAARDMDRAIKLAEQALAQGIQTPKLFNLAAYRLELNAHYDEALRLLTKALRISPNDVSIITSIGVCLSKAGRRTEALSAFDAALRINPSFAPAHNGRGLALTALNDLAEARASFERAIALDPSFPEPLGALAAIASEEKRYNEAQDLAERALALEPDQPAAVLTLAFIDQREGRYEAVVARVRKLLHDSNLTLLHRGSAQRLLADALDTLNQPAEALSAYQASNADLRRVYAPNLRNSGMELGVEFCERLIAHFEVALPRGWTPAPEPREIDGEPHTHVFLVGFPRSGTTLLEQALASHPGIVALEEKPLLADVQAAFFLDPGGLDQLGSLDGDEAARIRDLYWRRVREHGVEPASKVFVDKMPLTSVFLPLIAKLFPRARILLARRDPRDVVISCFRRRFQPNAMVVEFLDLERTALLYDRVMRLIELYRNHLTLRFYVHRHEALIADFDAETRAICEFLRIPWDAAMRDFAETAKHRDVRTPSATQVVRGLYREGMGQWRRYEEAVRGIMPILSPWVDRFEY